MMNGTAPERSPNADLPRSYSDLRESLRRRDRGLRTKVMSLEEAAALIVDGTSVGIGGSMMSRTPMAMIWQLIRSGRKDLVCSRSLMTSDGDLLLGSGLSDHIITSWVSQGIMWGISKVMRRHVESDRARYDEWSHLAMGMRFRAGAMGVPFMPMRPMLGSDVLASRPGRRDDALSLHEREARAGAGTKSGRCHHPRA